jgi:hypothetical protein
VVRVHRLPVAVVALGLFGVGCSLLVDLSDTTGGTPGSSLPDGAGGEGGGDSSSPPDQGAPRDAGVPPAEGMTPDGGVPLDAGEGGVSPDGARPPYPPGSWCASNAPALFFCDDFDDGSLGSRWTTTSLQVAGAATLSSMNAPSPPNDFDLACPALMPSTFLLEVLTESIPSASKIALAFDIDPLMFAADGRGGPLYLATLSQGPGTPRSAIQFRAGNTLTDLQEQVILASGTIKTGTGQWASGTLAPAGMWTHVEMLVDFTASPAAATLRLNGKTVVTANLDSSWTRAPATFDLGDWYIPTTDAFHVAYDNVTIDVTP